MNINSSTLIKFLPWNRHRLEHAQLTFALYRINFDSFECKAGGYKSKWIRGTIRGWRRLLAPEPASADIRRSATKRYSTWHY